MRPSQLRTRLARARKVTGLTQKEFAEITGISLNSLKHYENGDNDLFAFHASEISHKTGISGHWLIGVGSEESPVGIDGEPYTVRHFQIAQAKDQTQYTELLEGRTKAWINYLIGKISSQFIPVLIHDTSRAEMLGCELDIAIRKALNELKIVELMDFNESVDSYLRSQMPHDALALSKSAPVKRSRRARRTPDQV